MQFCIHVQCAVCCTSFGQCICCYSLFLKLCILGLDSSCSLEVGDSQLKCQETFTPGGGVCNPGLVPCSPSRASCCIYIYVFYLQHRRIPIYMYMSTVKVSELSEYVREMRARENSYHVTQVIFAHLFSPPSSLWLYLSLETHLYLQKTYFSSNTARPAGKTNCIIYLAQIVYTYKVIVQIDLCHVKFTVKFTLISFIILWEQLVI